MWEAGAAPPQTASVEMLLISDNRPLYSDTTGLFCHQTDERKQHKEACYHLPRTVSREGPSAPFLCGCLKERRRENNERTRQGSAGPGLFSALEKELLVWFCMNLIDRPRTKEQGHFSPAPLKRLQRDFSGKQARRQRCRESKAQTQRGRLLLWWKQPGRLFTCLYYFSGFLSRRAREQSIRREGDTLMEKWKSIFGELWPGVGRLFVLQGCSLQGCSATIVQLSSIFFVKPPDLKHTHTHADTQDGHTLTMLSLLKKQACLWKHTAAVNRSVLLKIFHWGHRKHTRKKTTWNSAQFCQK